MSLLKSNLGLPEAEEYEAPFLQQIKLPSFYHKHRKKKPR